MFNQIEYKGALLIDMFAILLKLLKSCLHFNPLTVWNEKTFDNDHETWCLQIAQHIVDKSLIVKLMEKVFKEILPI